MKREENRLVSDRDQVKNFLLELKMTLSREGKFTLDDRDRNLQSLAILGMLPSEVPGGPVGRQVHMQVSS